MSTETGRTRELPRAWSSCEYGVCPGQTMSDPPCGGCCKCYSACLAAGPGAPPCGQESATLIMDGSGVGVVRGPDGPGGRIEE